jgi:hypothetical protein
MTIYRVRLEEVEKINARRKEVGHSDLVTETRIIQEKDGPRCEYEVSEKADPHAVGYIFFGDQKRKEKYEAKLKSGEYFLPAKKICSFRGAQT